MLRFAGPAGLIVAAATFSAYALARARGLPLAEQRTAATLVALILSLCVLALLALPLTWRRILLLVLLIAFNTASIGTDERSREHATMMAFGLSARTVLGITATESLLIGVLGTVTGVAAGYGLLAWLTTTTIASVMPEIGITAALSAETISAAVLLGTAAVAAAPLFTLRKLRRTDIPATLRIAE